MRSDAARYTAIAILLHWLIALGIVILLVMGLVMTHLPLPLYTKFAVYQLHKSIGFTVLALAAIRLLWRLAHGPPALPPSMPALERHAARSTHFLFYVLMFFLPLTGWAVVSSAPISIPTRLFSLVIVPPLDFLTSLYGAARVYAVSVPLHVYASWLLIGLVAVHTLGALHHHLIRHDDVLIRMLPRFPWNNPPVALSTLETDQETHRDQTG